jgi:signal transduction histidine kinase
VPGFDDATGRFTGYRGTARRPRGDEQAAPVRQATPATDSLRQLVHELRTPTNAIVGFAEMIESELLGPVAPVYRDQARVIRTQTRHLIGAIDDLDFAARIESRGLDLRSDRVAIGAVIADAIADLEPLATLRGATFVTEGPDGLVDGDARAVERLVSRLLAAVTAAAAPGERIAIRTGLAAGAILLEIDRPEAMADYPGNALFTAEDASDAQSGEGGLLLGSGFAFRLARNLVHELGGSMVVGDQELTLRLPAAVDRSMEQATI